MKAVYISHSLSDKDVANFARQSFSKIADSFTEKDNNNLVRFLARGMSSPDWEKLICEMANTTDLTKIKEMAGYIRSIPEHWVPFGHPTISLRMQAPVPIRTQCFKHKIGFVESEESRRYISSVPEVYVPPEFRAKAANVKQGSGDAHKDSDFYRMRYSTLATQCIDLYEKMIEEGVCPEQARFILPQGTEVNWVWTGSLYAFAKAYVSRTNSHAQKEVQDLFKGVGEIIEPLFPVSWAALTAGKY